MIGIFLVLFASLSLAYQARILMSDKQEMIYFTLGKEAYNNKNYDLALIYFDRSIELNSNFPEAYHNLALTYYKLSQINKSIQSLNKAIELDGQYSKAYYSLALIYYESKDYDNAISNLEALLQIDQQNTNALFDLGVIYVERFRQNELLGVINVEDLEKALYYYSLVLDINPDFPNAASNTEVIKSVLSYY